VLFLLKDVISYYIQIVSYREIRYFCLCYDVGMDGENVIKVKSVSKERQKHLAETNKYIRQYGELLWMAALVTAYQGGGYEDLKNNYEKVPLKYLQLLLDAYKYKNTELEFLIAQAASRPHMKKGDGKKYIEGLANKLEGKE